MARSDEEPSDRSPQAISRRQVLTATTAIAAATLVDMAATTPAAAQATPTAPAGTPNILFIMGDDIGWFNVSAYNMGIMGYRTPNIDRIGKEGRSLPTGTASKAAPPGGPRSSPASPRSAPA